MMTNPDVMAAHELAREAGLIRPTGALLDDVRGFIGQYVIVTSAQLDALALWVAHTYVMEAADTTPYVSLRSAEKQSGKSRVCEVCELIVHDPLKTENISVAALAHSVESGSTLLLDEVDAIFGGKGKSEVQEQLRGILDSGYRRGGAYVRMVGMGTNMEPKKFSTFGPKMLSGIGSLPGTLEDRSIKITMKRKTAQERVERFRIRVAREQAKPLCQQLKEWGGATTHGLLEARPDIPDELNDRLQDAWEPLLAIADHAGGEWAARARRAAVALAQGDVRDDESLGVRLLADIRDILNPQNAPPIDRIRSDDLRKRLIAIEEAPWGDLYGRDHRARKLSDLLKPYEIKSHNVRFPEGIFKGFERADFEDPFTRYLPLPAERSATTATPSLSQSHGESATTASKSGNVADKSQTALEMGVAAVAAKTG